MKNKRVLLLILVCAVTFCVLPVTARAGLSAIMYIDGEYSQENGSLDLTVFVEGEDLRGGRGRIVYDPARLAVVSVAYPEEPVMTVSHSQEEGIISFVFLNDEKFSGTADLMTIAFIVIDGQEGDIINVDLTDRTASDGEFEVVPLFTPFSVALPSEVHTEVSTEATETETVTTEADEITPGPVTKKDTDTVAETTAPDQTTEPETEPPETETEGTDTVTVTETETETTSAEPAPTDTSATDPVDPPTTAGPDDTGSGDEEKGRIPPYMIVIAAAAALLLIGGGVFLVIYLSERRKNKLRNE